MEILLNFSFGILKQIAKVKFANTEKIKKNIKDNNFKVKDME